jgi:two-component system, chemotaxis family, chemotaxis protein CheY
MSQTIMTVDDSPSVRELVAQTLRDAGFAVIEAEDGADALSKLETNDPDMIFTDLNMPRLNGIEFIRQTRTLPCHKYVPIVMLTSEFSPAQKQAGRDAGASGWILKPFTPEEVLSVIKKFLPTDLGAAAL